MWNRVFKQGWRLAGMIVAAGALGAFLATSAEGWRAIRGAGIGPMGPLPAFAAAKAMAVSGLVFVCISALLIRSFHRDHREEVRNRRRSLHLCGGCGYNLLGNESGVCPECGTRV